MGFKNLKILNIYSEYIKNSAYGSIKDHISETQIENKDIILDYLKKGDVIAAACGRAVDFFTGEKIDGYYYLLSDGEYEWGTDTIYFVEKYNLVLPKEFTDYVLKKSNISNNK